MEISYKRHFNQSYMILAHKEEFQETYELSILSHNKISGFLSVNTEISDGKIRFWYDITGRQSLRDYLIRRQVNYELLYLLFDGIEQVLENIGKYLLDEENILLQEEHIYLDFTQEHMEFTYLPGWNKDCRRSFRELMELLLQRLDHSDKQAVAIAYEMYQCSLGQEESFSVMVKKALNQPIQEGQENKYVSNEWRKAEESYEPERCKESELYEKIEFQEESKLYKKSKIMENFIPQNGLLRKWIKVREKQEEPYIIQNEKSELFPTEILSNSKGIQGVLIYQGAGELSSIRIDKPIFVLGKKEEEVDGYINGKSVSRIHARIEYLDEDYYIEDLNSTNGTYLNGEALEYHQKAKLEVKDRITFGMEEYIFV